MAHDIHDGGNIEYHPPKRETLYTYAWQVGQGLGEDYTEGHVVRGLTAFLQAVAEIEAAQRNRGLVDEGEE